MLLQYRGNSGRDLWELRLRDQEGGTSRHPGTVSRVWKGWGMNCYQCVHSCGNHRSDDDERGGEGAVVAGRRVLEERRSCI